MLKETSMPQRRRRRMPLWVYLNNFKYGTLYQVELAIFRWRQNHKLMTHDGWMGVLMFLSNLVMAGVLVCTIVQNWHLFSFILAPLMVCVSYIWAVKAFYERVARAEKRAQQRFQVISPPRNFILREWDEMFQSALFSRVGLWGAVWLIGYLPLWVFMEVSGSRTLWLYAYPSIFFIGSLFQLIKLIIGYQTVEMPSFVVRSIEIEDEPDDK